VLTANRWAHLALVYRNGDHFTYLNSEEVGLKARPEDTANKDLYILGEPNRIVGLVDAVYAYDRSLSAGEVRTLFKNPYAPFMLDDVQAAYEVASEPTGFPPNSLALTGVGR
jgi:hypothetical protein